MKEIHVHRQRNRIDDMEGWSESEFTSMSSKGCEYTYREPRDRERAFYYGTGTSRVFPLGAIIFVRTEWIRVLAANLCRFVLTTLPFRLSGRDPILYILRGKLGVYRLDWNERFQSMLLYNNIFTMEWDKVYLKAIV